MGKSSGSAPAAPDPKVTIAAQSEANKEAVVESSRRNAVDIYGPGGSTTYRRNADGTPFAQVTELSDTGQYTYGQQQRVGMNLADTAVSRAQGLNGTQFSLAGVKYDPNSYNTSQMPKFSAASMSRNGAPAAYRGPANATSSSTPGTPPTNSGQPPGTPAQPNPHTSKPGPTSNPNYSWAGGGFGVPPAGAASSIGKTIGSTGTPEGAVQRSAPSGGGSSMEVSSPIERDNPQGVPPPQGGQPPQGGGPPQSGQAGVIPYDPSSYGNVSEFTNKVGDAVYGSGAARLDPQFKRQERELSQSLANRGLPINGEAYSDAMSQFRQSKNDAYTDLANKSTAASLAHAQGIVGTEQGLRSTAWNENIQGHQQSQADWMKEFQVQQGLRQQSVTDTLQERNQGINELSAILQGSPALSMPNAPSVGQYNVNAPDVIGAHNSSFNAQMQSYKANQANANAGWNGVMGVASAAAPILMSSRAMKHKVRLAA
jgi:hypothetical protein